MSGEHRIPWVWVRIVRACHQLTPFQKLIYDETRGLSNGRGATLGAGALGLRLGMSRESVECARRELLDLGLVRRIDLGQGRSAAWFADLPPSLRPRQQKLDDDAVQRSADLLDQHIREKRG